MSHVDKKGVAGEGMSRVGKYKCYATSSGRKGREKIESNGETLLLLLLLMLSLVLYLLAYPSFLRFSGKHGLSAK